MAGEFAWTIRSRVSTLYKKSSRDDLRSLLQDYRIFLTTYPIRGRYVYIYIYTYKYTDTAWLQNLQISALLYSSRPDLTGIGIGCASYISIIFPTENRSDGCRVPREMAKYAWHNLKANVQGEGLPSWPDTDVPPIPNPYYLFWSEGLCTRKFINSRALHIIS